MILKFKNVEQFSCNSKSLNFCIKFTNTKAFNIFKSFSFSNANSKTKSDEQKYHYDYEAPERQELNLKTIGLRILKKIGVVCSIFSLIYILLFRKYNEISKRQQYYFLNEKIELKIANYVSKIIKTNFEHSIFKHDSEETKFIFKIYQRILEKNKINLKITLNNIFVLDSISFGAFLNKNGDLFISNRIIELAEEDENEAALFIAVEISSNLMGNFANRVISYFLYGYLYPEANATIMRSQNFISHNIDKLNKYNRFLYFYPDSVISTYYEEVELIQNAIKLLKKGEFNVFQSIEILKKFEEKIKFYPRHYEEILFVNRESRFYEGAKNFTKIYLI